MTVLQGILWVSKNLPPIDFTLALYSDPTYKITQKKPAMRRVFQI